MMTQNNNIRKWGKLAYCFLITFGILVILYPFGSQTYYQFINKQEVNQFDQQKKQIESAEIQERIDLAKAYNRTLTPEKLGDPFTQEEKKGVAEYARMLQLQEKIGYVSIPSINQEITIRAGTSEDVLQSNAGHLEGTSLPVGGKGTHTVITAHRGLPSARLFTDLDKVKIGDVFYITNLKETLAYKVDQILVVTPDNFDPVLVTENKDYATLLTCTPYMVNSHRLLVRGTRVPLPKEFSSDIKKIDFFSQYRWYIILISISFVLLLGYIVYLLLKRRRKSS